MGWFQINVVLPLVAPILVLLLLKPLPMPDETRRTINLLIPVKDGQLCWIAIGLAASALYDIGVSNGSGELVPAGLIGYLQGTAIGVIAASSILAAGGAMYPTLLEKSATRAWYRHYSTLMFSAGLAACADAVCGVAHFGLR